MYFPNVGFLLSPRVIELLGVLPVKVSFNLLSIPSDCLKTCFQVCFLLFLCCFARIIFMGCCPVCLKLTLFSCMLIRLKKGQEGSLGMLRDVPLTAQRWERETNRDKAC